jgi:hypothetical protein
MQKTHNKTQKTPLRPQKRKLTTQVQKTTKHNLTIQKRQFNVAAEGEEAPARAPSKRKATPWDKRNPHANDELVEEDKPKIDAFLEPLGLGNYKDKFTSFDQVLMTKRWTLKEDFGMSTKERKLLRKHANYYRVGHYYKTGEIYVPKYEWRQPLIAGRHHNDFTSEDDCTFTLPAKDGLYKAHLRYPGSSYKENYLVRTYHEDRFFVHRSPSAKLSPEARKEVTDMFTKWNFRVPESAMPRGTGADNVDTSSEDI